MQGRASECAVSRADSASDLRTADSLGKSVRGRAPLRRGFSEDFNAVTMEVEAGPRATGEALVSCGAPEAAPAPRSDRARRCTPSSHASRPQPSAFLSLLPSWYNRGKLARRKRRCCYGKGSCCIIR